MNRVIHFEIQADNPERVQNFYSKALGWKFEQMMSKEKDGMDYWSVVTGEGGPGINGGLYNRSEGDADFRLFDCTVTVDDLDKTIAAVLANGGRILKERSELKGVGFFATAQDTEGNRFGLLQATEWKPK